MGVGPLIWIFFIFLSFPSGSIAPPLITKGSILFPLTTDNTATIYSDSSIQRMYFSFPFDSPSISNILTPVLLCGGSEFVLTLGVSSVYTMIFFWSIRSWIRCFKAQHSWVKCPGSGMVWAYLYRVMISSTQVGRCQELSDLLLGHQ